MNSNKAELVALCTAYRERFSGPSVDFMLVDAPITTQLPATIERETRRAFVEAVEGIWCERRRKRGRGSTYLWDKEAYDGPLLRLLIKVFEAMDEPYPPSRATLHHDLHSLTGEERKHKNHNVGR